MWIRVTYFTKWTRGRYKFLWHSVASPFTCLGGPRPLKPELCAACDSPAPVSLPLHPNMDTPAVLLGVAMAAGDVGPHASTQDSPVTHPVCVYGGGGGPWVRAGGRAGSGQQSVSGCALVYYIPMTPQALSLNIIWQTSHLLLQADFWHLKTSRNASQDPNSPPTHPVCLWQALR